jgi:hypothetical protein
MTTHGPGTLLTASEVHGTGAGIITHGTAAHGLSVLGITEGSMILGTMVDSTVHGTSVDSMNLGTTAGSTILGIMADSTTHGIMAGSTGLITMDGMVDGIRSGLDIIRDTILFLTIMAKTYGEVRDMRPAQTGYLQAAHLQEEVSDHHRLHAERWLQVQPKAFPELQLQAALQQEGLLSEPLRQQGPQQLYEAQPDRAM